MLKGLVKYLIIGSKIFMNESKLTPYRLPVSILIFFISFAALTRTVLLYIPTSTSMLIAEFYPSYDAIGETNQIALLYAISLSVIAHFGFGKLIKQDPQENKKGLCKNLGIVVLIAVAYIYSRVQ